MKKGTILKNLWAGYESYFVYMGWPAHSYKNEAKKTAGYSLINIAGKWKFEKAQYYCQHLNDREHFPIVGYIDINSTFADCILKAISEYRAPEEIEE